jgi:rubrerythrin
MSPTATKPGVVRGARNARLTKNRSSAKKTATTAVTKASTRTKRLLAGKATVIAGKLAVTRGGAANAPAPRTLTEFMRQALVIETEAAQRYAEFADAMEMHNNRDVAALFRKLAGIECRHATQIMAEMGWKEMPAQSSGKVHWEGLEAPETTPGDEVHYLMQPYHALELALANEQRAERFFARLVQAATVASVRKAARALQAEEREHVALVRAWMKKIPKPTSDWAHDPDPPTTTD